MAKGPILAAVDFSDASRRALDEAVRIARERGVPILLVHALTEMPRVPAYAMSFGASDEARQALEARAALAEAQKLSQEWAGPPRKQGLDVEVEVGEGAADDLVLDTAQSGQAQIIVVGSHGWKGFKRFVLGSVAQSILQRADVPVLVVPTSG